MAVRIDDESTLAAMRRCFEDTGKFVCPHTAVGLAALRMVRFQKGSPDKTPAVVLATAHPGKFASIVERATGHVPPTPPAWAALERSRRAPRDLRAEPAALAALLRRLA
jgi:threonine synthase